MVSASSSRDDQFQVKVGGENIERVTAVIFLRAEKKLAGELINM